MIVQTIVSDLGVIKRQFSMLENMRVAGSKADVFQDVPVMHADDFATSVGSVLSARPNYLCSSTLASQGDRRVKWVDCAAMPDVFEKLRSEARDVVVAEAVELGSHTRYVGDQYIHADGVAIWRPASAFVETLQRSGTFGTIAPRCKDSVTRWRQLLEAAEWGDVDHIVTHNFNRFANYTIKVSMDTMLATRSRREPSIWNDLSSAHFTSADPLINLCRAYNAGCTGTFLIVAPSQDQWNWVKLRRPSE